jgi:hypothetical protein
MRFPCVEKAYSGIAARDAGRASIADDALLRQTAAFMLRRSSAFQ